MEWNAEIKKAHYTNITFKAVFILITVITVFSAIITENIKNEKIEELEDKTAAFDFYENTGMPSEEKEEKSEIKLDKILSLLNNRYVDTINYSEEKTTISVKNITDSEFKALKKELDKQKLSAKIIDGGGEESWENLTLEIHTK